MKKNLVLLFFGVMFYMVLAVLGFFPITASAWHGDWSFNESCNGGGKVDVTATYTPTPEDTHGSGTVRYVSSHLNLEVGNIVTTNLVEDTLQTGSYTVTNINECHPPVTSYTVTASTGGNGTITPASQAATSGTTVAFTVTPNSGYTASMGGTCPAGTLVGTLYTTGNITGNCTVIATFTLTPITTATISATKIVCPTENLLPNWGANGPSVTSTTASAFIAANPTCHIVPWTFEWAPGATLNPGDEVGVATGAWTSFTGGTTLIPTGNDIWVREQFNSAYIPFTGVNTTQNVSAELYCNTDVLNYDNYDEIYNPNANTIYNCVGFNVLKETPVTSYTVTASKVGNGTITPASQAATSGTTVAFTVTPNSGYTASMGGTCPAGTLVGTLYTTGNITGNCTVIATFTLTPVETATISATKIICPTENLLPNWGAYGPDITSTTVSAFLTANPTCHSVPWTFEWAPISTLNPGDQVGVAGGAWTAFTGGSTTIPTGNKVWVREQFNSAYIPFTGVNTTQNVSAELYCSIDVLNYDNYDRIDEVNANNTYRCVGFNVLKTIPVSSYTVTASTGGNGTITPATQEATSGTTAAFTVTPNSGYTTSMGGTCPAGTLVGTLYTTGNISSDCTVIATFTLIPVSSYTVTASTGGNGTITPSTQTVNSGSTTTFTVTPATGYTATMGGTCLAGTLVGTLYTTGNITSNCTVIATFTLIPAEVYTITSSATGPGTITPASQEATSGTTATFTVTPNSGYTVSMGGTCPVGTLVGTLYTTGNITGDCTVIATFTLTPINSYTLTVDKPGTGTGVVTGAGIYASGTVVTATATPNSDSTFTGWSENCPGGIVTVTANTTCTATFTLKVVAVVRHTSSGSSGSRPIAAATTMTTTGQVLGEATTCGIYVDKYMRMGLKDNNKEAVTKVQIFLNAYMGTNLKIDGIIGIKTDAAIRAFQVKQFNKVLYPWGLDGSTGIFYLTTQTEVNNIMCPTLNLPIPPLVPMDQNPLFPKF